MDLAHAARAQHAPHAASSIDRSHAMDSQQVLTAGQTGLHLLLMIAAPIVLVVLVVGLVVNIFQAVTQINESTLSFIPKLIAAIIALTIAGPWILSTLVDYLREMILSIPRMVG